MGDTVERDAIGAQCYTFHSLKKPALTGEYQKKEKLGRSAPSKHSNVLNTHHRIATPRARSANTMAQQKKEASEFAHEGLSGDLMLRLPPFFMGSLSAGSCLQRLLTKSCQLRYHRHQGQQSTPKHLQA